jgi:hypothetical protein
MARSYALAIVVVLTIVAFLAHELVAVDTAHP